MDISFMESTPILKISEMAEDLIGSEIIKLSNEVKQKIKSGEDIYNFTIGDFDPQIFPIPKELKKQILAAYKDNQTNYPAANGIRELRQAISRFLHTRGHLEYHEDQILVSAGARPLIYGTYQTLLDPGDTVIFPTPSWNNNHYTHLNGARPIPIETSADNNFMPTAEDIKPFIQDANLIALCSPLNPTGTVFGREQLTEICQLILDENRKRGEMNKPIYLLYDQIYWMLSYGSTIHHDPVSLIPEMKNYTVYIDGISKAFASTGLRVGWAFGPKKIIDKMRTILSHLGAWAPRAEQVACAKYLNMDDEVDEYLSRFKDKLNSRLAAFYEGFQQLKAVEFNVDAIAPLATIYLAVQLDLVGKVKANGEKLANPREVTEYLLNEAKIALVPFSAFGAAKGSTWYRLSVGTASMNDIGGFFSSLKAALEKLS